MVPSTIQEGRVVEGSLGLWAGTDLTCGLGAFYVQAVPGVRSTTPASAERAVLTRDGC